MPEYRELAKEFHGSDAVVIASVDADRHKNIAAKYGVTDFPTIKWFARVCMMGAVSWAVPAKFFCAPLQNDRAHPSGQLYVGPLQQESLSLYVRQRAAASHAGEL